MSLIQQARQEIIARIGTDAFSGLPAHERAALLHTEIRRIAGKADAPVAQVHPDVGVDRSFRRAWQRVRDRVGADFFEGISGRSRAALVYEEMRVLDTAAILPCGTTSQRDCSPTAAAVVGEAAARRYG